MKNIDRPEVIEAIAFRLIGYWDATAGFDFSNDKKRKITIDDIKDWLLSEYQEPIKLTRFEHELLINMIYWGFKYLVRSSRNLDLYAYKEKPKKALDEMGWINGGGQNNLKYLSSKFQFIKPMEGPCSIEALLKVEVMIDV